MSAADDIMERAKDVGRTRDDATGKKAKKRAKKDKPEVFGLDGAKTSAEPGAPMVMLLAIALLGAFGIQHLFAAEARADIPGVQRQVAAKSAERDTLAARYRDVIENNKDELLARLRAHGTELDALLPYFEDGIGIEGFELTLEASIVNAGIEMRELSRGALTEGDVSGTQYIPVSLTLQGPRDAVFAWIDGLSESDRLVTVQDFTLGIRQDDAGNATTNISASMRIRLWFSDSETVLRQEATSQGVSPEAWAEELGVAPPGFPSADFLSGIDVPEDEQPVEQAEQADQDVQADQPPGEPVADAPAPDGQ